IFWTWLPFVLGVKLLCLLAFGVRRLTWRYVSLFEVWRISLSLGLATLLLVGWRFSAGPLAGRFPEIDYDPIPLGVLCIDLLLGLLAVVGLRVTARLLDEWPAFGPRSVRRPPPVPTLLIGAGRRGA